jgi:hypothetical protein
MDDIDMSKEIIDMSKEIEAARAADCWYVLEAVHPGVAAEIKKFIEEHPETAAEIIGKR